jgi:hypothetical protein
MDNLNEIEKLFECRIGSKYAGDYTYYCKNCHKECNVSEAVFECKDGMIIPTFIICRYGCGESKWKLKISLQGNLEDSLH